MLSCVAWSGTSEVPKWLCVMPGSVFDAAFRQSAPAFVAGMLIVYVHGRAKDPGSALSAAVRIVNFGGRAFKCRKSSPGSAQAAFRTTSGSGNKIVCNA